MTSRPDQNGDEDDGSLFRRAMSDVNTQHKNYSKRRNNPAEDRPRPPITPPRTRPAAHPVERTGTSENIADQPQSPGSVQFARPGLQRNIIRKLNRGQYTFESTLDLHGLTRFEADESLEQFIAESLRHSLSCVLIIHGKGYRSKDGQSVLKQFTHQWLKEVAAVKAFCSAQPRHGGSGAVYVLLKTSNNQRK